MIDLLIEESPKCCLNFLKLCKMKYFNFSLIHSIRPNYAFQTGDPLYGSKNSIGGTSIWGLVSRNESKRYFVPDSSDKLSHDRIGTVSFVCAQSGDKEENGSKVCGSEFIVSLGEKNEKLDSNAVFGRVVEGLETLDKINQCYCDESGRPLRDIRIKHTYILEDPFDDPEGLEEPASSPEPTAEQLATVRIGENEEVSLEDHDERKRAEVRAKQQALTLEMVGDLPFAEVKPKENQLFICKLNPATQEEDLELIFSRFGKIVSCQLVRDKATGESLQYGFIDYENKDDCERAYMKMDGVLIDDRRIHVDFSQSVSRLQAEAKRNRLDSSRSRYDNDVRRDIKHRRRGDGDKAWDARRDRSDKGSSRRYRHDKYDDRGYRRRPRSTSRDSRDRRYDGEGKSSSSYRRRERQADYDSRKYDVENNHTRNRDYR